MSQIIELCEFDKCEGVKLLLLLYVNAPWSLVIGNFETQAPFLSSVYQVHYSI